MGRKFQFTVNKGPKVGPSPIAHGRRSSVYKNASKPPVDYAVNMNSQPVGVTLMTCAEVMSVSNYAKKKKVIMVNRVQ